MRDPNRIPIMIARLQAVWEQLPDMRLGQLISNVITDPFYIEDEELLTNIERYMKKVAGVMNPHGRNDAAPK